MSEWVKLCRRDELPAEGQAKEFSVAGRTLCVATLGGKPLALDNVCPHRGGPLAEGTVEHGKIVCPWHQWEFDLVTGAGTPNLKAVPYALRLVGDDVLVEI
ncbi:MAG: Rieske (2Fe-2S) protein [Acidobacteriaceae bacterium]